MTESRAYYTATPKIGDEESVWHKHNTYLDAKTQLHPIDAFFEDYGRLPPQPVREKPHTPTLDELEDLFRPIYEPKTERQPALDRQVGGDHYKKGIQPWEIIEAFGLDFWEGNALKYLLRRKNNRLEDLEKARHYLDYLIEREQAQ